MDAEEDNVRRNSPSVDLEITRVWLDRDHEEHTKDEIVVEDQTELYVDDATYAVFSCSPHERKELVVGHLLTEGVIRKPDEIAGLEMSEGSAHIRLAKQHAPFHDRPRQVSSACASGTLKIPPHLLKRAHKKARDTGFRISRRNTSGAVKILNSEASIFRRTGGTHAAALVDDNGRVVVFSEDIGRHNAVDKAIGKAALKGESFERMLLASTGRITFEMVIKAATVGIPVIVSISAPTDKAVKTAAMLDLTLIGFARARRFNIYTCPERIVV